MKTARFLTMTHLFLLFVVSVILPFIAHSAEFTNLLSWTDGWSSSKAIEKRSETSEGISKLSFIGGSPPLHLSYDRKAVDKNIKTISELENNQLYIILNGQPGDLFNFCFRTPPAFSSGNLPYPPVIKKPLKDQGMPDIQNGGVRLVPLAPDSDRWQHEYSASWRLPKGNKSLVLSIENNENGWVLEPECSGIVSESTGLPSPSRSNIYGNITHGNKEASFVEIFFLSKQAVKNGPDYLNDKTRLNGPFSIPGAADIADNSQPFASSSGGGFGGSDDLDDLFKKRPGSGLAPLYSFEWVSELFSRMVLVPVPGTDRQTVKKQVWDNRIVLKIRQGWNEQRIIISQELWNRIREANLERSSELFLALSGNPHNPEAVFDHYLDTKPAQSLQPEDYSRYAKQEFILSPKQLRSVSVFPGHCPSVSGCSGGASQVEKEMADLSLKPPTNAQSQRGYGLHNQGSRSGRGSGGDDGPGGSPNTGLCQHCNKPAVASNKCLECQNRESELVEQEVTKGSPPVIRGDKKIPEPVAKGVDNSAAAHPRYQSSDTSKLNSVTMDSDAHREDVQNARHHSDAQGSEEGWQLVADSRARKGKKKKRSGFVGKSVVRYPPCAARHHNNPSSGAAQGQQALVDIGLKFRYDQNSTLTGLQLTDSDRGDGSTGSQLTPAKLTPAKKGAKVTLKPLLERPLYDTPLIDIGANLVGKNRFQNLPAVVADAVRSGVGTIILTGASIPISRQAQNEVMTWGKPFPASGRETDQATAIGDSSDAFRCSLYYTVGCHPHMAKDFLRDGGIPEMKKILKRDRKRCIAVGECGLDYDRNYSPVEDQKKAFRQQLALAVEMKKPLFLHERNAHDDFKEILVDYIEQLPAKKMACVHCFTGNSEALQDYIDLGCSIGITGWIAGSRNRDLVEALRTVGWDVLRNRLMIETDAPFLRPFRVMSRKDNPWTDGKKRVDNVPANLPYVVHALSVVLGVDAEEIAAATTRNAREIFSLFDDD
ncbi:TatD family hydrolase [Endozoicomonas sp. 8E]|uniref:TatD family hydrolase n=1 Tax=Endozoicomonas sp. 8E TaxID=3035692 RepID=UPI002938F92A|nr:TatD family hydrolase [Endozoicomonas sp. 8E]WOG30022.1 TatD family hydrolase [Endozoicomonas sp. 8E]